MKTLREFWLAKAQIAGLIAQGEYLCDLINGCIYMSEVEHLATEVRRVIAELEQTPPRYGSEFDLDNKLAWLKMKADEVPFGTLPEIAGEQP